MNSYTLDPSKVDSTLTPTHPTIYPSATPAQPTTARTNPVADPVYPPGAPTYPYGAPGYSYGTPHYPPAASQYYPYQYPSAANTQPERRKIRDWLVWSIINIFIAGLVPGVLPLIFTLLCRSKKRKNDFRGARTMSTFALVFNVICTVAGIIALVAIIIYFVVLARSKSTQVVY